MVKGVAELLGCGKVELVTDRLILYRYVAAAARIKVNRISEYLCADPIGCVVACNETELDHVDALFCKDNPGGSRTVGNRDDLSVVYLDLITGCADYSRPGERASVVFKLIGELVVVGRDNVRPERGGSAYGTNAYLILSTLHVVDDSGEIVFRIGHFVGLAAYLELIACRSLNSRPGDERIVDTYIGGSSKIRLCSLKCGCIGRCISLCHGINADGDLAADSSAFSYVNVGGCAVVDIAVIVSRITAGYGYHIVGRVLNRIPAHSICAGVVYKSANRIKHLFVNKCVRCRGCIALCYGSHGESDTVGGHRTVSKAEYSGGAVIYVRMIMSGVAAHDRYVVSLGILNGIVYESGVEHLENRYLGKSLVAEISYRLCVVGLASCGESGYNDAVLTCGIVGKGNVNGSSVSVLVNNGNTVTVDDLHVIASGTAYAVPFHRAGLDINDGL